MVVGGFGPPVALVVVDEGGGEGGREQGGLLVSGRRAGSGGGDRGSTARDEGAVLSAPAGPVQDHTLRGVVEAVDGSVTEEHPAPMALAVDVEHGDHGTTGLDWL